MKYYVSVPMIKKNLVSQNVFKVSKQLAVGLVFPGADKTAMYRGPNGLQTACCLFSQENHILGLGGREDWFTTSRCSLTPGQGSEPTTCFKAEILFPF